MALVLPVGTTLVLNGTNAVESTAAGVVETYGIYARGDLTVSGTGSLTAKAGKATNNETGNKISNGVHAVGTLTVTGGSLTGVGDATSGDGNNGSYGTSYGVDAEMYGNISVSDAGSLCGTAGTASAPRGIFALSNGVRAEQGDISVSGGTLTGTGGNATAPTTESNGVYTNPNKITVSGGQLTANTTGAGDEAKALRQPLTLGGGVNAVVKAATNSTGSGAVDVAPDDTGGDYKWVRAAVQYTVTLDPNGGAGGTASTDATYGDPMPAITPPTRANSSFNGYFDALTGGTKYYNGDGTSAKAWDKGNATLYAQWASVTEVTVSPATASVVKSGTQSFGATVNGENNPEQTVTWSVEGNNSNSTAIDSSGLLTVGADEASATLTVRATSTVDPSKSGTATVTVTLRTYAVTYNANGGSGTMANGTATQGAAFTLPGCTFTAPAGQQFKEWAIGSLDGTRIAAGGTHVFDADATIFAIWENIPAPPVPPAPSSGGSSSISGGGTSSAGNTCAGGWNGNRLTVQNDLNKLTSVVVDNKQLTRDVDFTAINGSTIITFTQSYLSTLADGAHTIRVTFTDGRYDGTFTTPLSASIATAAIPNVPATGGAPAWAFALALPGLLGTAYALRRKRV